MKDKIKYTKILISKIPQCKRIAISLQSENDCVIKPIAYFQKEEYAVEFLSVLIDSFISKERIHCSENVYDKYLFEKDKINGK